MIDATHDAKRRSWVESANGHPDFPIQNLPFGIYSKPGERPRGGVAIGDEIFDLKIASEAGLFSGEAKRAADAAGGSRLNGLFALGAGPRAALRARLVRTARCRRLRAARDGRHEAAAAHARGRLRDASAGADRRLHRFLRRHPSRHQFRAGCCGRTIRCCRTTSTSRSPITAARRRSGCRARRCAGRSGQRKPQAATEPDFGPCRYLDYELELGVWIGPGNELGTPIPIGAAREHVAGFCLLNDWSARDIQAWEYQPLGPFLAKNFASTVSPWVVTPEALAPFRTAQPPRPEGDPRPLDYLMDGEDQAAGAFGIDLEASILTEAMRTSGAAPHRLAASNAQHLYWTVAQMVAHHTCGGCNLEPGDLIGTGTISAPDGVGSMLELTRGGREPATLPSGETRRFLDDGDEVIFRAYARRDGFAQIGFGECRGRVVGAA